MFQNNKFELVAETLNRLYFSINKRTHNIKSIKSNHFDFVEKKSYEIFALILKILNLTQCWTSPNPKAKTSPPNCQS